MAHELRRIYTEAFPTATDAIITLLDHQGNEIKAWFNKHFLAHEDGHANVSHDELRDAIDAAIDPFINRVFELERRLEGTEEEAHRVEVGAERVGAVPRAHLW